VQCSWLKHTEIILVFTVKEVMSKPIEDISLLSSLLFIKCCLYALKSLVTHDMCRCYPPCNKFRNLVMGPKASMIKFWNPAVVPTV
jgi:hypothetical protein